MASGRAAQRREPSGSGSPLHPLPRRGRARGPGGRRCHGRSASFRPRRLDATAKTVLLVHGPRQAVLPYSCETRMRVCATVSKNGRVRTTAGPLRAWATAVENRRVSLPVRTSADEILAAREQYVARGVSTPSLVVARAEGAQVHAVDGTAYLDFAGGIACQNTGHGFALVVAAIHEQVDRFLHQCFMVGTYEPYVEVCRRLAQLSPCRGESQKSILVNSGAEAVENAVKIARAATGRPAVVVFENGFHGRTLLTMAMTSKVRPYKAGFGPFPGEIYRAAAPYPYRGIDTNAAIESLEHLFLSEVDAESGACVVLETVQGEGGFIPMPSEYPARLAEICAAHGILYVDDEVQSGIGRTGPMWAIEHYEGVEPDLLVSGKSLGGGLPLAAVTGRSELMDAPGPGALGGTFGGNPVACAAAAVVLDTAAEPEF